MKQRQRSSILWLGGCLALCACGDGEALALPIVDESRALPLADGVLFLDEERPNAYVLDVTQKDAKVQTIALPEGQRSALARPPATRGEVVVLTTGLAAGERDGELAEQVPSHVLLLSQEGELARYALPNRFTALTLSEDGRYAVAHALDTFGLATATAVVDLDAPPSSDNPVTVAPSSLDAQTPYGFVFSPERATGSHGRRLLLGLSESYVNIIDLDHVALPNVTVPLTLPDDPRKLVPEQVLFDDARIFVRSRGSDHVQVIQLTPVDISQNVHGFEPSLLSLPTGGALSGMALVGEGEGARLLALTRHEVVIIDPATGKSDSVAVRGAYETALTFVGEAPGDDVSRERLLLLGTGRRIAFMDSTDAASLARGGLDEVDTGAEIVGVHPLLERDRVVLEHEGSRMSLVDLVGRTVTPLLLPARTRKVMLDRARERLWIAFGDDKLGTVALGPSLSTEEVLLDAAPANLLLTSGEDARLVALHAADAGFATVFGADDFARPSAKVLLGFFWDAVLDGGAL